MLNLGPTELHGVHQTISYLASEIHTVLGSNVPVCQQGGVPAASRASVFECQRGVAEARAKRWGGVKD